jgi:nucleotide-binding universal stress UspA family protein
MVAFDGSDASQNALEWVVGNMKSQNPDMILVTVSEGGNAPSSENEWLSEAEEHECHDALKKGASWVADQGLEVDAMLAVGDSRKMISEAIEKKNPDLVVVGRHGDGGFHHSVSQYLVKNAGCNILILHA